ncbi:ABC transporter substrate-binding protein [Methylohalobius crimeensis]|uniref:ABC transporter substrate-binding protein n=1 Tax=Methylohalobius crimeensis TaxID=244365 RepID=UPI0003B75C91|nr:ABC transporter substrate-binding protein [Methylohalobius crimeensis]
MRLILRFIPTLKTRSERPRKFAPHRRRPWLYLAALMCLPFSAHAAASQLTIGALAYGTLNWELTVVEREGLDKQHGFDLKIRELANPQAGRIALQSGSADLIVTDWLWVARQRNRGSDFTVIPYSLTHGALVVPPESPIRSIRDLAGRRLGIAGGALDKNWLLLQALAQQRHQLNLAEDSRPVFGAPPLLSQQLLRGRMDALLTYWHYAAPLEAKGYRRLLTGGDLLEALDVTPPIPTLGYVFRQTFAERAPDTVEAFWNTAFQAKQAICTDDRVWSYIAPMTGSEDSDVQALLRRRYCEGRLQSWGERELQAAAKLYRLLHRIGGEQLTGPAEELPEGTFWPGFTLPN